MHQYIETTANIKVSVMPIFLDEKSIKNENFFVWAYSIRIDNFNNYDVQLISRYWKIIDQNGSINEVSGDGVIGLQPVIKTKDHFIYSSGVHLKTPSGIMFGHYFVKRIQGKKLIKINVPMFSLDSDIKLQKPM